MRGDYLAHPLRINQPDGSKPKGLTVFEIAIRERTGIRTHNPNFGALAAFSPFYLALQNPFFVARFQSVIISLSSWRLHEHLQVP